MAIALVPVTVSFGFIVFLNYLPVAFSAVYGMSASVAGLFILPMTVPVLLGSVVGGSLKEAPCRPAA